LFDIENLAKIFPKNLAKLVEFTLQEHQKKNPPQDVLPPPFFFQRNDKLHVKIL